MLEKSSVVRRFATVSQVLARMIAFVAVLLSGAATQGANAQDSARDFIGQLRGLDHGAIAISTDGHNALAYVCDGTSTRVSVAQWFKGAPAGNDTSLVAGKAVLDMRLEADRASGTVTLADGRTFTFRAVSLTNPAGDAGLFRSELDSDGHHYIAGWIQEPARTDLQPAQLAFVDGWFDWSNPSVRGGIIDELRRILRAPSIGPDITEVVSPFGELSVHRVRLGRTE